MASPSWAAAADPDVETTFEDVANVPSYMHATIPGVVTLPAFGSAPLTNWTIQGESGSLANTFDATTGVFTSAEPMTMRITWNGSWDTNTLGQIRFVRLNGTNILLTDELRESALTEGGFGQTISNTLVVQPGDSFSALVIQLTSGVSNLNDVSLLLTEFKAR